jgi:hypothetical protein
MLVDARTVQEAENLSKETHLAFRDCLDIVIKARLKEGKRSRGKALAVAA